MNTAAVTSLVVLAATCLVAHGQAVIDTTGMRFWGFTMVSNVAGYSNMTLDYCDMQTAVAAGNFTGFEDLYTNGKNSMGGAALRKFKTWAVSAHPGEPTYDMLTSYNKNNSMWLDWAILNATAAKNGDLALGLVSVATHYKYFFHEVDAAFTRTKNNLTNVTSGAPHNLDEAWTLWAGAHYEQCNSLYKIADKLAEELGTSYYGHSPVNWAMTTLLNNAQYSTMTGNSSESVALFNTSIPAMYVQTGAMLVQGMMREAYVASVSATCGKPAAQAASAVSRAVAYWSILAPQLSAWGATTPQIKAVESELMGMTVTYSKVAAALVASLPKAIDVKALGTPTIANIDILKGCKA